MATTASQASWFDFWKENMKALGFPIPDTWYATEGAILALISAMAAAVEKFGTRVTIGELIGAGVLGEQLAFIGALNAAYFVGAAIGSAAVATGRYLSGGASIADVFAYAASKNLLTPGTQRILVQNPQIYTFSLPARSTFARRMVYA